jgi:hypothetical protein
MWPKLSIGVKSETSLCGQQINQANGQRVSLAEMMGNHNRLWNNSPSCESCATTTFCDISRSDSAERNSLHNDGEDVAPCPSTG